MYLIVIAWLYVVLMMSVAEAFGTQGSVLGAVITFVLYGVLPLSLVLYIMNTPHRKARLKVNESQVEGDAAQTSATASPRKPDASGHAARGAQQTAVPPVGKEP